jgi:hypothetical protein
MADLDQPDVSVVSWLGWLAHDDCVDCLGPDWWKRL